MCDDKTHAKKVMSAELMMVQFIAAHNIPFQTADHLSDLFTKMFPDSRIAVDFRCKHTKIIDTIPYGTVYIVPMVLP